MRSYDENEPRYPKFGALAALIFPSERPALRIPDELILVFY